jgi:uncharacterized protein (TIGR02145 family)
LIILILKVMKKILLLFSVSGVCILTIAQVPESFNYQEIPRNASGVTYPDQSINVSISILSGSPASSSVYTETFNATTTNLGLLNLQIGKGTPVSGSFTTIDWASNSFYLIANPVNNNDVATKDYVDALLQKINELESQPGIVKDVDGNLYKTIKIGPQVWITENLKTTKYKDGTAIPLVADNTAWSNLTTPGYCWYTNNEAVHKATYGALYNWYVVSTGNLCPFGWHVPSNVEWTTLTDYLGGTIVAGGKLKETGTTHWASPNTGATNETGFTALPGGYRYLNGTFYYIGSYGFWWSATEIEATVAWSRNLYYSNSNVTRISFSEGNGFSVRCLRDN